MPGLALSQHFVKHSQTQVNLGCWSVTKKIATQAQQSHPSVGHDCSISDLPSLRKKPQPSGRADVNLGRTRERNDAKRCVADRCRLLPNPMSCQP